MRRPSWTTCRPIPRRSRRHRQSTAPMPAWSASRPVAPAPCCASASSRQTISLGGEWAGGGLVYVGNAEGGWANALAQVCEPWMPEGTWQLTPPDWLRPDAGRCGRLVSRARCAEALARGPPQVRPPHALSLPRPACVGGRPPIRLDPCTRWPRHAPGRRCRDCLMAGAAGRPAASRPPHRAAIPVAQRPAAGRRWRERRTSRSRVSPIATRGASSGSRLTRRRAGACGTTTCISDHSAPASRRRSTTRFETGFRAPDLPGKFAHSQ